MGANSSRVKGFFGPSLDLDTPIYKIYQHRFLEGLLRGKFVIPSTHDWPDPWEWLVSDCSYVDENQKSRSLGDSLSPDFAQCWSLCRESDALWRIYSKVNQRIDGEGLKRGFGNDEAVRLKTTAGKLLNALVAGVGIKGRGENCFIAKVNYSPEDALLQELTNRAGSDGEDAVRDAGRQASARLLKRDAFAHEQEVRLLYVDTDKKFENKIEIAVNPNSLIEEITIDPRILAGEQETYRTDWIRSFGFKNEVNRSLLYIRVLLQCRRPPLSHGGGPPA